MITVALWDAGMEGVETLETDLEKFEQKWTTQEEIVWVVGTHVRYAISVEFGQDPHTIRPDDAEVLHFTVDGEEVFTNVVEHPGTAPQPYMRPASEQAKANLGQIAGNADDLDDALSKIAHAVERYAKQFAPVESGNLKGSIKAHEES